MTPWYLRCTSETTAAQAAVLNLAASCGTRYPRDLATQALLIRSARSLEERAYIIAAVLESRASWLRWLTLGQRDWQAKATRRPSRARHHDSLAIRESYVRCSVAR